MSCRRAVSLASHCDFAIARWVNQAAAADVSPPMAAPVNAATPEISDASMSENARKVRQRCIFVGRPANVKKEVTGFAASAKGVWREGMPAMAPGNVTDRAAAAIVSPNT